MADRAFGIETLCLHAGQLPDAVTGSRAQPIYQTTSYVFDSADHAASLFNLQTFGNVYSRISNPTVAVFEERVAALENGRAALATSSGMAAQLTAILAIVQPGEHIVASSLLYGGTYSQFAVTLPKMGIQSTLVDPDDPENFKRALQPNTRLVYAETLGNPKINVLDIEARRRDCARRADSADDRQHDAVTLSVSSVRLGCRYRCALGDKIHRRTRHDDRWRTGRKRKVRLGQRQVSRHGGAIEGLSRRQVLGDLR